MPYPQFFPDATNYGNVKSYFQLATDCNAGGVLPVGNDAGEFLSWNGSAWTPAGSNYIAIGVGQSNTTGANAIYIGQGIATTSQINTIAIGAQSGQTPVGANTIAIGAEAGVNQNSSAIAIGTRAGYIYQSTGAIAIGSNAARSGAQGIDSIAIGTNAGAAGQNTLAIAIGEGTGGGGAQGPQAVAIGAGAQGLGSGLYAIGIGSYAGTPVAPSVLPQDTQSIVINASGNSLASAGVGTLTIKPVRNAVNSNTLYYDNTSGEVTYSSASASDASPASIFVWAVTSVGPAYSKTFYRSRIGYSDSETVFNTIANNQSFLCDAAWNGSYWLFASSSVVNGNSVFYKTSNGKDYETSPVVATFAVKSITWLPTTAYWVAVGNTGGIYRSYDGFIWTLQVNPGIGQAVFNRITKAVAITAGFTVLNIGGYTTNTTPNSAIAAYSLNNGATWTVGWAPGVGVYNNAQVVDFVYTDGEGTGCMFVENTSGAGNAGAYTVVNFTGWATVNTPNINSPPTTAFSARKAAWNGTTMVMVGDAIGAGTAVGFYSKDRGLTWAPCFGLTTANNYYLTVTWNGGNFFASSELNTAVSTDGETWVETPQPVAGQGVYTGSASQINQPFVTLYP